MRRTLGGERAEIERLRVENRALLNSVLGTAGVPPIETPPMHPAGVPAVRRRSWPQIATQREIEVAREARGGGAGAEGVAVGAHEVRSALRAAACEAEE